MSHNSQCDMHKVFRWLQHKNKSIAIWLLKILEKGTHHSLLDNDVSNISQLLCISQQKAWSVIFRQVHLYTSKTSIQHILQRYVFIQRVHLKHFYLKKNP